MVQFGLRAASVELEILRETKGVSLRMTNKPFGRLLGITARLRGREYRTKAGVVLVGGGLVRKVRDLRG